MFTLVLHSHLPWLANHGRWPVGEEWLYQSWAASYLPVTRVLRDLAAEGRTGLVSLGITPVLAAQLDDPHCLAGMHHWLGNWQLRAHEAALRPNQALRELGTREHRAATVAIADFELRWRHGGSPVLRELIDTGAVELLGGPLAHPFQPLLHSRLREFSLVEGLHDAHDRWGVKPPGIWAPECGFAPGMEHGYAAAGVRHFLVDGPALRGDTALGRPVRDSDVVAFGRDLKVSYRVWSPKSGYPGHGSYRDFHTYDHRTGLKPSRVTGRTVDSADKAPYDPDLAAVAVARDAADFVATVRNRLRDESARIGRPAHVVAAFDTELFGHWWHEGPQWLDAVLRALPEAGVRVGTLAQAHARGLRRRPVRVDRLVVGVGQGLARLVGRAGRGLRRPQRRRRPHGAGHRRQGPRREPVGLARPERIDWRDPRGNDWRDPRGGVELRDATNDQLLREALLTVASDWVFMISKDSAAGYARDRAHLHAHATREIADAVSAGHRDRARRIAEGWRGADYLFPRLDARRLPGDDRAHMKILIVSWEYPPVVVGGLGRHVHHLATELAAAGHEVVVLSRRPSGTDAATHPTHSHFAEGVLVVAVAEDPPVFRFGEDMLAWTLAMGHAMVRAGVALGKPGLGDGWTPDVVHAHDWLVAHPAIALAEFYDVPLVSTLHATEAGRHSGWVSGKINRQVHSVEWWLANESDALITCSESMRDEVSRLYGPKLAGLNVIRNGIDVTTWSFRDASRMPVRRACCSSGGSSTRRASRTRSPRSHGSAAVPRYDADDRGVGDTAVVADRVGASPPGGTVGALRRRPRPRRAAAVAASRGRDRAPEPLRAVRHHRARGRRRGHAAGGLDRRRPRRGRRRRRDRPVVPAR